jgi:hypothetical protein
MSNKKETAVEWFVEKLKAGIDPEDGSISMNWLHDGTIEQAKKLEKQQIIDAYWDGGQDIPLTENRCEQYYNETYEQ